MHPEKIREYLRKQPFRALRFHVSDGSWYDVRHPEMALVTRMEVVIARATQDDELPETAAYVDPIHITRVEPINGRRPRRQKRRR